MSTAQDPFSLEVTIAAPADRVWQALRDRDEVLRWHGWELESLEQEVDVIFFTDTVESPDHRTLVTNGGDTWELFERGSSTVVRLTRGPRDPSNEWDQYYDDINEGWTTFLNQLRFALERHPGEPRRTIYLEGLRVDDRDPLDDVAVPGAAGEPYERDLGGSTERGTVFFRSANQLGLTVDGWGDGLVVVGRAPVNPYRPQGGAMAVITTYGLLDDRRAELEQRWTALWAQRFPKPEPAEAPPAG